MNNIGIYLKAIFIPLALGGIVGFLISGSMNYDTLTKPFLAPPSIVFPIVWSTLYILMGVSYGILKSKNLVNTSIRNIYYLQLGVNLLWPIAFFVLKLRLFAFVLILFLAVLVAIMIYQFYQKNKLAGLLQIPYLIWVLFATYLNLGFYLLNR